MQVGINKKSYQNYYRVMTMILCVSYVASYVLKERYAADLKHSKYYAQIPYIVTLFLLLIDAVTRGKNQWDNQLSVIAQIQGTNTKRWIASFMHAIFIPILFACSWRIPKPNNKSLSLFIEIYPWYGMWYAKNCFFTIPENSGDTSSRCDALLSCETASTNRSEVPDTFTRLDLNVAISINLLAESVFFGLIDNGLAGNDSASQVTIMCIALALATEFSPVFKGKLKNFFHEHSRSNQGNNPPPDTNNSSVAAVV